MPINLAAFHIPLRSAVPLAALPGQTGYTEIKEVFGQAERFLANQLDTDDTKNVLNLWRAARLAQQLLTYIPENAKMLLETVPAHEFDLPENQ